MKRKRRSPICEEELRPGPRGGGGGGPERVLGPAAADRAALGAGQAGARAGRDGQVVHELLVDELRGAPWSARAQLSAPAERRSSRAKGRAARDARR